MNTRLFVCSYARMLACSLLFVACSKPKEEAKPKDADPVIAALMDAAAKDSMNWEAHAKLAGELRRKNRLDEARAEAEKAFAVAPSPAIDARLEMAKVYAAQDRTAAAINLVKDAEKQKKEGAPVDEVKLAEVYAVIGDPSAVFRWLDRAGPANSPNLATVSTNPDLASVHADPRWAPYAGSSSSN